MEQIIRLKLDDEERRPIGRALERAYHLPDDVLTRLQPHLDILEIKENAFERNIFSVTARGVSSTQLGPLLDEVGYGEKELTAAGAVIREIMAYYTEREARPWEFAPDPSWNESIKEDARRVVGREVLPGWNVLTDCFRSLYVR